MISFGPVPSRRLGKSLGVNNIPGEKKCTYSCIYCQVGVTKHYLSARESFYDPSVIFNEVNHHLEKLSVNDKPDYLTFVANGEPTLDINLGKSIIELKKLNIPIAVITNASLLYDPQVCSDLMQADWISVKIDTGSESIWKKLNRPLHNISFEAYLKGLDVFSKSFKGFLASETMLVRGVNDSTEDLNETTELIQSVAPSTAYISIPTRPPALSSVEPPSETVINEAYQIFSEKGIKCKLILGFEGTDTGFTGNAIDDIINICTVHPIREDTMLELLKKNNTDVFVLESLLFDGKIKKVSYNSKLFYIRQFRDDYFSKKK
ncbi:MAG: radical SAM protein [Fermentimonas sp.]|jgi:wyosine [tRNA(Phe)-imidazoG37] synthetase (radical SAM superfamily)|nr:radical SAM protein [Fermentimonas sp.]NLC86217.1 radical SAM protein [Bacteroidales bacterium]MDD2931159.1 radical SAM protein [Fermentimonas sp.]MDD3188091.1 radical SAM protein [Fermentimonas sp.]MDD3511071.1 radical SAM protein [Fermentimonas sp.]